MWPIPQLDYNPCPHPLFLQPKPKWKNNDEVQFITFRIDNNQLQLIINNLTFDFPSLKRLSCPTN